MIKIGLPYNFFQLAYRGRQILLPTKHNHINCLILMPRQPKHFLLFRAKSVMQNTLRPVIA